MSDLEKENRRLQTENIRLRQDISKLHDLLEFYRDYYDKHYHGRATKSMEAETDVNVSKQGAGNSVPDRSAVLRRQ